MEYREMKDKVDQYLVLNKAKWIRTGKELMDIPEIGFCEEKTGQYVENRFRSLGLEPVEQCAVTGRIARLKGKESLANIAFMAELDAIYCPTHKHANKETGQAHACGHHIQVTALLAVAEALQVTEVMKQLSGDVTLIGVPAEECIPEPILQGLQREGKIQSDCGKKELMQLGLLKELDIVLASHALVNDEQHPDQIMINTSCNGLAALKFTFRGKTAHSTVCPEKGLNALNAAVLAINGIQALRESFDPGEYVRVSYNLTEGGQSIGNVPDVAVLEVVIAAKTMDGLTELQKKITVAAECGASVLGCAVQSEPQIGYLPYGVDPALLQVIQENGKELIGETPRKREHNYFSNDLGDVSQILPTAQIVFGGFQGDLHSDQFRIVDEDNAYVLPARTVAATILDLLANGAEKALRIKRTRS